MKGLTVEQKEEYDKSLEEWKKEDNKQHEQDKKLLAKIKECVSSDVFNYIECEIQESENTINYRIVPEPIGDLQDWIDHITWVDQRCGMSGDDFHGTVCMELSVGRYLVWNFWM